MRDYLPVLRKSRLFEGIDDESLLALLTCMSANARSYARGETLLMAGDEVRDMGVVLRGSITVSRTDAMGERAIVLEQVEGGMFAEALVCASVRESPVSVHASQDCEVMYLQLGKLITACSTTCGSHVLIVRNLLTLLARRNLELNQKLDILSKKTLRERLLTYLSGEAARAGAARFSISFTRDELADYLCANRSALSRELGSMREEGLVDFHRNQFDLKV